MIVTEFWNGQGFGNQLWCYAVTKSIAIKNNYKFGIKTPEKFKGRNFMNIDFGETVIGGYVDYEAATPAVLPDTINNHYREKMIRHPNGCDISLLDNNILNISDDTKIDGVLQSINYFKQDKKTIQSFFEFKYECLDYKDMCVIHFRGGDFNNPQVLVNKSYYDNAINFIKNNYNNVKFCVVTDDINLARQYFSNIPIVGSSPINIDSVKGAHHLGGDIGVDFTIMKNAKYLIIPNSSFSWWSAYLNNSALIILAPKYWARFNISDGYWSTGDSLTKEFMYLDREGNVCDYDKCYDEYENYKLVNKHLYN